MLTLFILVPWVLTVIGLMVIILLKNRHVHQEDDEVESIFDNLNEVIRVAVYEDAAYWVHENVFYQSEVVREPDFSTARPVDTMELSEKELSRLMIILDELKESERD